MHPTALILFRSCMNMAISKGVAQLGASIQSLFLPPACGQTLFIYIMVPLSPLRNGPSTATSELAAGLSHPLCPVLRVPLPLASSSPSTSRSHLRPSCHLDFDKQPP